MANILSSPKFKTYNQAQTVLLPLDLGDMIDSKDLVRLVNDFVNELDVTELLKGYKGGGTTAFHPKMLLKAVLYGYCMKIYTGRKIARELQTNTHFMWLVAGSHPDFRTINSFVSSRAKDVINLIFKGLLSFLVEKGYIKMERYFCDGSTFRADGNQYKMVWKKNSQRYKDAIEEKCKQLFKEIEALNDQENKLYGNADLEEKGGSSKVTREAIAEKVAEVNQAITAATTKSKVKRARELKQKLTVTAQKIEKYEIQERTSGGRSGYNTTDEDASAMRMKNKKEILPAYNIMAGCEDQFITGISVHQNSNDGACFEEHLDQIKEQRSQAPTQIIADSGFGSEKNYAILENEGIENYVKFPSFHTEQTRKYNTNKFKKESFEYNKLSDTYICPNNKELRLVGVFTKTHKKTGFESTVKEYRCEDCSGCSFYEQCCRSQQGGNRTMQVNERYEKYKAETRENLDSEKGKELSKKRSIEIESFFGDVKHNMGFRRFTLRGLKKVNTQMILIAMAHNLRKMHAKNVSKAA